MSRIPAPKKLSQMALLADMFVVVVFVAVGRRSHEEGSGLEGFLRVWWPFALGLVVATFATGMWKHPFEWRRVIAGWLGTVAIGMLLRIVVQGRDFKPSFVIVTIAFLGLGMLGWRWLARRLAREKLNPLS